MSIKRVVETRSSPYLGERGEPKEFLKGLQIGHYTVSSDNPGISFVARRGDSPNGIYVRNSSFFATTDDVPIGVYAVPVRDLVFDWSVGHTNHNLVFQTGMEYGYEMGKRQGKPWFKRIVPAIYRRRMPYPMTSQLSTETVDVLKSMIGTSYDYFARNLGIRDVASEIFAGNLTLKEEAGKARMQQQYQPGFNLNTLLRRASEQKDLPENFASPEEETLVKILDEVFAQVDREISRGHSSKGRIGELYQRIIF